MTHCDKKTEKKKERKSVSLLTMLNIYNRKTINHRNSECDKARLERRRGDVRVTEQRKDKSQTVLQETRKNERRHWEIHSFFSPGLFWSAWLTLAGSEIKSEITQLSSNAFYSYLVSEKREKHVAGKKREREKSVVAVGSNAAFILGISYVQVVFSVSPPNAASNSLALFSLN